LCLKHMVLPDASTGLDCDDPSVQDTLVASIGSPKRLDMLLLLAIADMRSLGLRMETGFREELLTRAWRQVRERMLGLADMQATVTTAQKRRKALLARIPETVTRNEHPNEYTEWISSFINQLPTRFLSAFNTSTLWRHIEMLDESRGKGPLSRISRRRAAGVYDLTYVGPDEAGLLAGITGRLALEGLSIQEARIFSLPGRLVLDSFRIVDTSGRILNRASQRERIAGLVTRFPKDPEISRSVRRRLGPIMRSLAGEVVADLDNQASERGSILRVTGPDAPGLLHMVADILHRFEIEVFGAIVTTEAGMVRDTFFTEQRGGKVTDPDTIRAVLRAISLLGSSRNTGDNGGRKQSGS
ncbi:MAG: hypothetical protein GXP54_03385, partial [Deltaproteobacteria bacterium]|nr:hypothetical protein [Deltaproteobacteria bacterium]